jgi:hypothetical protein
MTAPLGHWGLDPAPASPLVGTVWKARDPEAAGVADEYREVKIVGTVELGELGAEVAFAPVDFGPVESASAEWFADTYERVPDETPLDRIDARLRALQEAAR